MLAMYSIEKAQTILRSPQQLIKCVILDFGNKEGTKRHLHTHLHTPLIHEIYSTCTSDMTNRCDGIPFGCIWVLLILKVKCFVMVAIQHNTHDSISFSGKNVFFFFFASIKKPLHFILQYCLSRH